MYLQSVKGGNFRIYLMMSCYVRIDHICLLLLLRENYYSCGSGALFGPYLFILIVSQSCNFYKGNHFSFVDTSPKWLGCVMLCKLFPKISTMREEEKLSKQKLTDMEKSKRQLQSDLASRDRTIQTLRVVKTTHQHFSRFFLEETLPVQCQDVVP